MSLTTWKKEFYPKPASSFIKLDGSKKHVQLSAIKHSLKKWQGLTRDNLRKHGLADRQGWISEVNSNISVVFDIDGGSCALCEVYYQDGSDYSETCKNCPLFQSLERRCDVEGMPFSKYLDGEGPSFMINALKTTLRKEEKA